MTDDPNQPVVLATVPTGVQAALIVAALRERGIEPQSVGELTSGFRTGAPGGVKILVRQADLDRAQVALRAIEADRRGRNGP
jgi:hypothetical protein